MSHREIGDNILFVFARLGDILLCVSIMDQSISRSKMSMARINLADSNSKLNVSRERESAMEFIGGRHTEFYRRGIHLFRPARFVNVERRLRWNEPHLISTQRLAKNQERNSLRFFFPIFISALVCVHLVTGTSLTILK